MSKPDGKEPFDVVDGDRTIARVHRGWTSWNPVQHWQPEGERHQLTLIEPHLRASLTLARDGTAVVEDARWTDIDGGATYSLGPDGGWTLSTF